MLGYPLPLEKVIFSLKKIPGIGTRSAQRIAFFLLASSDSYLIELSENIKSLKDNLRKCPQCFSITDEGDLCELCKNSLRDHSIICVLETYRDLITIEYTGEYKGGYHVLEGHLSPLDGITPEKLRIKELIERIQKNKPKEIILATNPNIEGDATAYYISKILKPYSIRVTRIAKGLPVGSDLEYADTLSLSNSFKNREEI